MRRDPQYEVVEIVMRIVDLVELQRACSSAELRRKKRDVNFREFALMESYRERFNLNIF